MSQIDLSALSLDELQAIKANIDTCIASAAQREIDVLNEMAETLKARCEENGVDVRTLDIFRTPPKYINPNNPDQTWSGRGKRPKWLLELDERGISLEPLV